MQQHLVPLLGQNQFRKQGGYLLLRLCVLAVLSFGQSTDLRAQEEGLRIQGTVFDKNTHQPVIQATVKVLDVKRPIVVYTDEQGSFDIRLPGPGRYTIEVSVIGYQTAVIPGILLTSGKTPVVNIALEEVITHLSTTQISAKRRKSPHVNSMALVSAKAFSIDEASRFAGSFDDPARMAVAYAGVQGGSDDIRNDIIIRGNSSKGLQWRLEGIEIPNPNHFSDGLPSGGAVSMLSANVLSNSNFLIGAFPADYGNALAGVFDLRMRKGNTQKREHAFQVGLLGIEGATEGPFTKNYKGSYMINYRYSLLGLIGRLVESQNSQYQDLTYNVYLPTKKAGNFSVFGLLGASSEHEDEQSGFPPVGNFIPSATEHRLSVFGLRNDMLLSKSSRLKFVVIHANNSSTSSTGSLVIIDPPGQLPQTGLLRSSFTSADKTTRSTVEFSSKLSKRFFLKTGLVHSWLSYDMNESTRNELTNENSSKINQQGNTSLSQGFINIQHRITNRLKWIGGLHSTLLGLNQSRTIEPRFALQWKLTSRIAISTGYGKHSRMEGLGLYMAEVDQHNPNKTLGLTQAQHLVLGTRLEIIKSMILSIEGYVQNLSHVPIGEESLSSINFNGNEIVDVALTGKGTGRNRGIDISLERPLNKGIYFLTTLSLFSSTFSNNGKEYATNFDGRFASSILLGKEFNFKDNKRTLILGSKFIWNGGTPITPLLMEESIRSKSVVEDSDRFNQDRKEDYIRFDFQVSYRVNKNRISHFVKLDIQNALNRKNQLERFYDTQTEGISWRVQSGVIPVFSYKILF